MRIVVLHGAIPVGAPLDEADVLVEVQEVTEAIGRLGHEPLVLSVSLDLNQAMNRLAELRPDVVFNLVEAIDGDGRLIHFVPALLDALSLAYTGAPTDAMYLSSNKLLAKRWLAACGIRSPEWQLLDAVGSNGPPFEGPYIVKAVWEHASIGIDDRSFIPTKADLLRDLEWHRARVLRPAFVESFVEGREFNLSILEIEGTPHVLPPSEIRFVDYPASKPQLVGYAAKWNAGSFEYEHTPRTFAFDATDAGLVSQLSELAMECWQWMGLRGYGRVDFRVDSLGRPWVLEVNANPCLSSDAGFMAAARQEGLTSIEVVRRIVEGSRSSTSLPTGKALARRTMT